MRKLIFLIIAVLICLSVVSPAAAAENQFVPSISYKDGPTIEDAEQNGEDIGNCLIITSITAAKEKTTDIYQEDRDLLLDVYTKLDDGTMKLPLDTDKYVIRELVDVSYRKTTCVEAEHGHKEWLAQDQTSITVTFDLGVHKTTEVIVMTYIHGEWIPVEVVKNNGDGTITCVFEDICPVVFCVEEYAEVMSPKTGDGVGRHLEAWMAVMVISLVTMAAFLFSRRAMKR